MHGHHLQNAYPLLNLHAPKRSLTIHIFQCMGKIFYVGFQRYLLKFQKKILSIHWKKWFLYNTKTSRALISKNPYTFMKRMLVLRALTCGAWVAPILLCLASRLVLLSETCPLSCVRTWYGSDGGWRTGWPSPRSGQTSDLQRKPSHRRQNKRWINVFAGVFLCQPWWRHQMETFSALLAICAGNQPVTG